MLPSVIKRGDWKWMVGLRGKSSINGRCHPVISQSAMELLPCSPIFERYIIKLNGPCSIAMLNYQRVICILSPYFAWSNPHEPPLKSISSHYINPLIDIIYIYIYTYIYMCVCVCPLIDYLQTILVGSIPG